jgi:surfactin family lipopeptide synthetase A
MNSSHRGLTMPIDDTLARLRAIWSEILHTEDVDDDDHFLELGGDSIAAVMCVSHIQAEFDVEVPVAMLFHEEMTLALLASAIESAPEVESTPDEAPV